MIAFDTNIYVYCLDSDAPEKRAIAIGLLANSSAPPLPLLWQVACEFLAYLRRQESRRKIDFHAVQSEMTQLLAGHEIVLPHPDIFPLSIDLMSRYSLSQWDSLLIAACCHAGVTTLHSEDMSHGVSYDTVTVNNPFLTI